MERSRPDTSLESRHSTVGPEKKQLSLATQHRVDADAPAEVGKISTASHTDMLTIVDEFTGGRVDKRAGAATQSGTALQDRDAQAATDERRGRRQTGQAATDNRDMRG
jgi:hypothetical protein